MANDDDIAIKIDGISKTFKLPHEKQSSIKGTLISMLRTKRSYEKQRVLKDVSFDIKKGEFFGIVGRNGSGKSTLLKLLAGIYTPDKGHIQINGSLTPFIELGVGFNPELTGRENVFLNGALLGFSRKDMDKMYADIVDFAELEKFMDQKLKNYSSGMQVRLAFSIAIRAKSDILVLDEVLAVGDSNFQKKCYDVFKKYKTDGKTVVLVTHDMGVVEQFCDKALLIEEGEIQNVGSPSKVTKAYNKSNIQEQDRARKDTLRSEKNKKIYIQKVWLEKNKKETVSITCDDAIDIHIKAIINKQVENPIFGITILDQTGKPLFATNTQVKKINISTRGKDNIEVSFCIENNLSDGNYYVVPTITNEKTDEEYDTIHDGHLFSISGWEYPAFVLQPRYEINVEN